MRFGFNLNRFGTGGGRANFTTSLLFNGYEGYTSYSGGPISIKDYQKSLRISPSNVLPSGGRWDVENSVWLDTHTNGLSLHPYYFVPTPNGLLKTYIDYNLRENTTVYSVGEKVSINSGDFELWMNCKVGGTSGASAPTVNASDIGNDIVDNEVTWTVGGYHELKNRYRNLVSATNKCLTDYPRPVDGLELSSGSPTINKRYRISAQSIVDFTSIGAADNNIGTEFVATGSGVTLSENDKLIPIVDGLGTTSYYNGSSFVQNISNLTLSGDTSSTLSVVSIPLSEIEDAVDENGDHVDMSSFISTYGGQYLGYRLNNSAGVTAANAVISGLSGNTNLHTASIFYKGVSDLRDFISGRYVDLPTASKYTRAFGAKIPAGAGTQLFLQCTAGEDVTFIIPNFTETSTVIPLMEKNTTRSANVLESGTPSSINGSSFAIHVEVTPSSVGQSKTLVSSYTDADNFIEIYSDATTLYFNKRVGGTSYIASVPYTHLDGVKFEVQCYFDTSIGSGIRYRLYGGEWSAYGTQADATEAVLSSNISIGNKNGLNQFDGHISSTKLYGSKSIMEGL